MGGNPGPEFPPDPKRMRGHKDPTGSGNPAQPQPKPRPLTCQGQGHQSQPEPAFPRIREGKDQGQRDQGPESPSREPPTRHQAQQGRLCQTVLVKKPASRGEIDSRAARRELPNLQPGLRPNAHASRQPKGFQFPFISLLPNGKAGHAKDHFPPAPQGGHKLRAPKQHQRRRAEPTKGQPQAHCYLRPPDQQQRHHQPCQCPPSCQGGINPPGHAKNCQSQPKYGKPASVHWIGTTWLGHEAVPPCA